MTGNDEKPREEDDARWITMEMPSEITVKNRFPMKKVCTPHAEILSLKRFGAVNKQVGRFGERFVLQILFRQIPGRKIHPAKITRQLAGQRRTQWIPMTA
jgi:hypothetical protein